MLTKIENFLKTTAKHAKNEQELSESFNMARTYFLEIQTQDIACTGDWINIYKELIEVLISSKQPIPLVREIFNSELRFSAQNYQKLLNLLTTMVEENLDAHLESLSPDKKSEIERLIALTVYLSGFFMPIPDKIQQVKKIGGLMNRYLSKVDYLTISEDFLANIRNRSSFYVYLVSEIKEYEVGLMYQQIVSNKRAAIDFKLIKITSMESEAREKNIILYDQGLNFHEDISKLSDKKYSPMENKSLEKSILKQTINLLDKCYSEYPDLFEQLFVNRSKSMTEALIAFPKYQEWLVSLLCRTPENSKIFYLASIELHEDYIASLCEKFSKKQPEKLKNFFTLRNNTRVFNRLTLGDKLGSTFGDAYQKWVTSDNLDKNTFYQTWLSNFLKRTELESPLFKLALKDLKDDVSFLNLCKSATSEKLLYVFKNRQEILSRKLLSNAKYQEWLRGIFNTIDETSPLFKLALSDLNDKSVSILCEKWSANELKNFFIHYPEFLREKLLTNENYQKWLRIYNEDKTSLFMPETFNDESIFLECTKWPEAKLEGFFKHCPYSIAEKLVKHANYQEWLISFLEKQNEESALFSLALKTLNENSLLILLEKWSENQLMAFLKDCPREEQLLTHDKYQDWVKGIDEQSAIFPLVIRTLNEESILSMYKNWSNETLKMVFKSHHYMVTNQLRANQNFQDWLCDQLVNKSQESEFFQLSLNVLSEQSISKLCGNWSLSTAEIVNQRCKYDVQLHQNPKYQEWILHLLEQFDLTPSEFEWQENYDRRSDFAESNIFVKILKKLNVDSSLELCKNSTEDGLRFFFQYRSDAVRQNLPDIKEYQDWLIDFLQKRDQSSDLFEIALKDINEYSIPKLCEKWSDEQLKIYFEKRDPEWAGKLINNPEYQDWLNRFYNRIDENSKFFELALNDVKPFSKLYDILMERTKFPLKSTQLSVEEIIQDCEQLFSQNDKKLADFFKYRIPFLTEKLINNKTYQEWLMSLLIRLPNKSPIFDLALKDIHQDAIIPLCNRWSKENIKTFYNFYSWPTDHLKSSANFQVWNDGFVKRMLEKENLQKFANVKNIDLVRAAFSKAVENLNVLNPIRDFYEAVFESALKKSSQPLTEYALNYRPVWNEIIKDGRGVEHLKIVLEQRFSDLEEQFGLVKVMPLVDIFSGFFNSQKKEELLEKSLIKLPQLCTGAVYLPSDFIINEESLSQLNFSFSTLYIRQGDELYRVSRKEDNKLEIEPFLGTVNHLRAFDETIKADPDDIEFLIKYPLRLDTLSLKFIKRDKSGGNDLAQYEEYQHFLERILSIASSLYKNTDLKYLKLMFTIELFKAATLEPKTSEYTEQELSFLLHNKHSYLNSLLQLINSGCEKNDELKEFFSLFMTTVERIFEKEIENEDPKRMLAEKLLKITQFIYSGETQQFEYLKILATLSQFLEKRSLHNTVQTAIEEVNNQGQQDQNLPLMAQEFIDHLRAQAQPKNVCRKHAGHLLLSALAFALKTKHFNSVLDIVVEYDQLINTHELKLNKVKAYQEGGNKAHTEVKQAWKDDTKAICKILLFSLATEAKLFSAENTIEESSISNFLTFIDKLFPRDSEEFFEIAFDLATLLGALKDPRQLLILRDALKTAVSKKIVVNKDLIKISALEPALLSSMKRSKPEDDFAKFQSLNCFTLTSKILFELAEAYGNFGMESEKQSLRKSAFSLMKSGVENAEWIWAAVYLNAAPSPQDLKHLPSNLTNLCIFVHGTLYLAKRNDKNNWDLINFPYPKNNKALLIDFFHGLVSEVHSKFVLLSNQEIAGIRKLLVPMSKATTLMRPSQLEAFSAYFKEIPVNVKTPQQSELKEVLETYLSMVESKFSENDPEDEIRCDYIEASLKIAARCSSVWPTQGPILLEKTLGNLRILCEKYKNHLLKGNREAQKEWLRSNLTRCMELMIQDAFYFLEDENNNSLIKQVLRCLTYISDKNGPEYKQHASLLFNGLIDKAMLMVRYDGIRRNAINWVKFAEGMIKLFSANHLITAFELAESQFKIGEAYRVLSETQLVLNKDLWFEKAGTNLLLSCQQGPANKKQGKAFVTKLCSNLILDKKYDMVVELAEQFKLVQILDHIKSIDFTMSTKLDDAILAILLNTSPEEFDQSAVKQILQRIFARFEQYSHLEHKDLKVIFKVQDLYDRYHMKDESKKLLQTMINKLRTATNPKFHDVFMRIVDKDLSFNLVEWRAAMKGLSVTAPCYFYGLALMKFGLLCDDRLEKEEYFKEALFFFVGEYMKKPEEIKHLTESILFLLNDLYPGEKFSDLRTKIKMFLVEEHNNLVPMNPNKSPEELDEKIDLLADLIAETRIAPTNRTSRDLQFFTPTSISNNSQSENVSYKSSSAKLGSNW